MKALRILPLIVTLALAACVPIQNVGIPATQPTATPIAPEGDNGTNPTAEAVDLSGTRWQLISFGASGITTSETPGGTITLEFGADGQAGGNGGCNSYGGAYQVQDSSLGFGQIASTLMACADNTANEEEQRYLQALQAAEQFAVAGDRLTLWHGDREGLLEFVAASPTTNEEPSATATAIVAPDLNASESAERVDVNADGEAVTRSSMLPSGLGLARYALAADAGQTMTVEVTSDGVPLSVIAEDPAGDRWEAEATAADGGYRATLEIVLPATGDYVVSLVKAEHTPSTNYEASFAVR